MPSSGSLRSANNSTHFITANPSVRNLTFTNRLALDLESSALVERLLNELLKTTEAFQTVKNENAVLAQEAVLNSQAHLPLQHENERLVKENNTLHL